MVQRPTGRRYSSWRPEATELGEWPEKWGGKEGVRIDTEKDKTLQDSVTDRVGAEGDFKILILSDWRIYYRFELLG